MSLRDKLRHDVSLLIFSWRRGAFPLLAILPDYLPWNLRRLLRRDSRALLDQVRRRKWHPQNWWFREGISLIHAPMPDRWIRVLVASWDATGNTYEGYITYKGSHHIDENLLNRIHREMGLDQPTVPKAGYIVVQEDKYVKRVADRKTRYELTDNIHDATIFHGGHDLDQYLLSHPDARILP